MSDNVLSLNGAAPPIPKVNDDVVAKLEELLARARDGRVCGLLYGLVSPEGHISTGWEGAADSHDMIAGAAILQHRVIANE